MKYISAIIFTTFIFLLGLHYEYSFAAQSNVGIIQGIWFSEEPFYENDSIRLYTAVQNNSGGDVDGQIEFFDNQVSIGVKPFSALNNRIMESWIDITPTSGKHEFTVEIKNIIKDVPNQDPLPVEPVLFTSEKEIIVYVDSDGDDVPDHEDSDDDNDGYDDSTERKQGTDPLDNTDMPDVLENGNNVGTESLFNTNMSAEDRAELEERIPDILETVVENRPFVENIAVQISRLQQVTERAVEKGHENAQEKEQENAAITRLRSGDVVSGTEGQLVDASTPTAKTSLWNILKNIVSVWWLFPIMIFVMIGLFLKLLFKIFGRRSR